MTPAFGQMSKGGFLAGKRALGGLLETDLERKEGWVKVLQFLLPLFCYLMLAVATVGGVAAAMGWAVGRNLLDVWIYYSIPVMGKEIIIPKVVLGNDPPPPLLVGLVTSMIDVCVSLFLIWNYDWVKRVKYIGPRLEKAEEKGRERVRSSKWFSKAAFTATVCFVLVPFKGAGGVGGTILGRIMGLGPYRVLLAVLMGSLVESLGYAYLSQTISPFFNSSPIFAWLRNVNMLQMMMAFVMFGLLVYVVRNPRRAVAVSSDAVQETIDSAQTAISRAEGLGVGSTEFTTMEIGDTLRAMNILDGEVVAMATSPISVLGRDGEKLAVTIKEASKREIDGLRMRTKREAMERVIRAGGRAEKEIRRASALSIVGLQALKEGVEGSEYLILFAGGKIERVLKVPKDLLRKGKRG